MKQYLIYLPFLAVALLIFNDQDKNDVVATPVNEVVYQERIINLPEDGSMWWTTIVLSNGQESKSLEQKFSSDPRLISLLKQTKTAIYTPDDPMYRSRFVRYYGTITPQVIVQAPDGKIAYKASGSNIPSNLADQIQYGIQNCRPKPEPEPVQPQPQPVDVIPDLNVPDDKPVENETNVLLYLIPFVTAGFGFFSGVKE
jgi:hypothetical protein